MDSVVQLENVTKDYGEGASFIRALDNVSLDFNPGEFTTMAGPSGSGKTTLLNMVGGLDRPTNGTIRVLERTLAGLSKTALSRLRRDSIGFIFQNYSLIPVLTAFENAEYVLLLQGVAPAERRERVRSLLSDVGLGGMENRFPRELSGGQQQRVAIARAIAPNPALILADEPTANLDSKTGGALLDLMENLNADRKITFLFSTHDPAVMNRARRLIWLHDGRIAYDGSPKSRPAFSEPPE